ncbi:hypothetical protein [Tahibacter harae]|uniref:Uncharacterized protein n=1 Tax=Tahibacter harae TaxID=2963937 RepID=A0ABT1QPI4_9GAMM|nr:hypothetical protein [Tahibacter harae]MCQ4164196.1 hypothetical protein [Tahibacter harae]
MIQIHGPPNPWFFGLEPDAEQGANAFFTEAATLGAALDAYAAHFGVRVVPMTDISHLGYQPGERKFFEFCDPPEEAGFPVDIHVIRGAEEICPKQDLDFPLQPGDRIDLGMLVC